MKLREIRKELKERSYLGTAWCNPLYFGNVHVPVRRKFAVSRRKNFSGARSKKKKEKRKKTPCTPGGWSMGPAGPNCNWLLRGVYICRLLSLGSVRARVRFLFDYMKGVVEA